MRFPRLTAMILATLVVGSALTANERPLREPAPSSSAKQAPVTPSRVLYNPHLKATQRAQDNSTSSKPKRLPIVEPDSDRSPRNNPLALHTSPSATSTTGPATAIQPRQAGFDIPKLPPEARELLPPGCLETWQSPGFGSSVPARPVSQQDLLGGRPSLGGPSLGGPSLGGLEPNNDPLMQLQVGVAPLNPTPAVPTNEDKPAAEDPHRALFLEDRYPSALTCAKCHPQHFEDWRVSAHAYASISPMFQRFEQTITNLSQGTIGTFCMRCHAPVATQEAIPRFASILEAPAVVREGITCVACHRVVETYGLTNGARRIEPGDIYQPVVTSGDGATLAQALANKEELKLKLHPSEKGPGQPIHTGSIQFETISRSDFCLSCHQVAVHPGIWLEVVYAQYMNGPAAAKGITCQDCHMGAVPGKPDGYDCQPIAVLSDKPYGQPRKYSSHMFWGPGYSIAHPGLFPIDEKGERWSPRQWLGFDWESGWGTDEFERALPDDFPANAFPAPWNEADERRDARRVLDDRLKSLSRARAGSIAAMEAGTALEGPMFVRQPMRGQQLDLHYVVRNASEGHNLPTGSLGAQPQFWLNVALVNPLGQTVWESGYLDTQGDLADLHSEDVARGLVPRDSQLFNLQTKFLVTNLKGTDREVALPVNLDVDQIAFLRPAPIPISVLNHPPLIRMEARSIPPLDHRLAKYSIAADRLIHPGLYRLDVRLRSRVEPSYFMRFVGSTPEMINRMNHQILDIHPQSFNFYVP